jgi:hypothetical protein
MMQSSASVKDSGAQVNLMLKAGTNGFHGALFEFLRNDKLDARDFFQPVSQQKSPFKQNQFGAAVGGPIIRNKTPELVQGGGIETGSP